MMMGTTPDLLHARAGLMPDAAAIAFEGEVLDYRTLNARAARAASLLHANGVAAGERMAVLCRNRPEVFELLFACARIGAILVPLNWRMPAEELRALVEDFTPALLLHDLEHAGVAEALGLPAICLDTDYPHWRACSAPLPPRSWTPDGIWYLLYTSGTTGRPKGVIYTFGMALANFVNIGTAIGLTARDRTPCFLPLFHTAGLNLHALPTLFAGGEVVMLPAFDAQAVVQMIGTGRIDTMFGVPTVYQALLEAGLADVPLTAIRHWGCGGAPLPDCLVQAYRDLGIRLCNGMGMTETGPTAFLLDPGQAWSHIGSVGKPQLLAEARVVDEAGAPVAPGEVGEIQFSGPGVTPGYWRNAAATRAAFTDDGWLRSGDLGRVDADGFFYVAGRAKEMFISGGENVYPVEVENVLASHPCVMEAAVTPMPDRRWGEVGRAFVRLSCERTAPEDHELQAYCRQHLAAYKVPVSFTVVPDFPRTSAGKIQKHLLA